MSVSAVILAAGFSTRMGDANKLLLLIGGKPVVRRVAQAVVGVCDQQPVVVLGYEPEQVENCLQGLQLKFVCNPEPAAGQASSVEFGLRHAPDADITLVALGDQPFLTTSTLTALLVAHETASPGKITVPMRGENRGNPIVLPRSLRMEILAKGKNTGCGSFTRQNPHLINRYETAENAYFFDIDTPQDLNRARTTITAEVGQ